MSAKVYFFSTKRPKRHQLKSGFRWKNYKCKCLFFVITSRDQSFTSKRGQFRFDIDNKWMVKYWNSAACWEYMQDSEGTVGYIGCARSASTEHILYDWQVCFFVSHPLKWVNLFLSEWQCSWQLCMSHYSSTWVVDAWTFLFLSTSRFEVSKWKCLYSSCSPFLITMFHVCPH